MHHMTKKSLLAKYQPLADAGASAVEVKNAITEAEKDLSLDQVDEIVFSIFDDLQEDRAKQPNTETAPAEEPSTHPMLKGKKLYDIFRGQWHPLESVTGFDGKDVVVLWEFRPEGKALKTGVPIEPAKADEFNHGKRIRAVKVFTEQMIPVGSTAKVYDELPDPTARRKIS